jgi:CBS domain containing-hemolysin-like protein
LNDPAVGKSVAFDHATLSVREMNRHRIRKVEILIERASEDNEQPES